MSRLQIPRALRTIHQRIHPHLPPLNFITLHYAYFIGVCLVSSLIFWGSSTPFGSVGFTDSLFLVVSAMTLAGLNTINLSTLNTFQQFMLFVLIMMGSAILVSVAVVHIRKSAFEKRFTSIVEEQKERRRNRRQSMSRRPSFSLRRRPTTSRPTSQSRPSIEGEPAKRVATNSSNINRHDGVTEEPENKGDAALEEKDTYTADEGNAAGTAESGSFSPESADEAAQPSLRIDTALQSPAQDRTGPRNKPSQIGFTDDTQFRRPDQSVYRHQQPTQRPSRFFNMQGVGVYSPSISLRRTFSNLSENMSTTRSDALARNHHFLKNAIIGRNSQFHGLTSEEKEKLGGVEYRAVTLLSYIVPAYFVLWQLLGCLGLAAYMAHNKADTARENGMNPWWVGAFNGVSAFNNSGMSLLDANLVPFQTSIYTLMTMGLMILAGNTCYPIFLRLILWTMYKLLPSSEDVHSWKSTLGFLLDHPRRCYTNLFPSPHTWWLLLSVIVLNGIDWVAFELLNIGNTAITSLSTGTRVLDGLFQAVAVRAGGFYIISISSLRIGLQFLYVIMMYISVYPVVITMRNSNVYEERSLGIYAEDNLENSDPETGAIKNLERRFTTRSVAADSRSYFIRQQVHGQLAHDLWWLVVSILFIVTIETGSFDRDPATYSVFAVIFEVVSAYGCVGISLGLPNEAFSFCGGWHKASKLILCLVMLRGRHRGLPVAIDKAVLLPGEGLIKKEYDWGARLDRSANGSRALDRSANGSRALDR